MKAVTQPEAAGSLEKIFVFSVLLLSTGAFMCLAIAKGQGQEAAAGESKFQVIWMIIYFIAVVLLFWKCKAALKEACRQYLLVALSLFAVASTAWSDDPGISLRRSIALVLTCLFGVYLGSRFSLREQLRLFSCVAVVCAGFSFIFGLLHLGTPVEEIPNTWYGIFVHKNVLGRMMVLSVMVLLISAKADPEWKSRYRFGAGLAILLLLLSRSTTSLAVLAAMLGFMFVSPILRRPMSGLIKGAVAFLLLLGTGVYWASQNVEFVLGLFGKDMTLTGRLQLWILSTMMALRKPWLGYGYNAFWLGPGSSSSRILAVVHWDAPHAHNGLLELWLELGLLGVGLFLMGFICYVGRAVAFLRRHKASPEAAWPLCFLVFMFLSNLTESDFLARNTIFWIVYVAVVVSLQREAFMPERESHDRAVGSAHSLLLSAPNVCGG